MYVKRKQIQSVYMLKDTSFPLTKLGFPPCVSHVCRKTRPSKSKIGVRIYKAFRAPYSPHLHTQHLCTYTSSMYIHSSCQTHICGKFSVGRANFLSRLQAKSAYHGILMLFILFTRLEKIIRTIMWCVCIYVHMFTQVF